MRLYNGRFWSNSITHFVNLCSRRNATASVRRKNFAKGKDENTNSNSSSKVKSKRVPMPPKPPQKPFPITMHGRTWNDPYYWMSELHDRAAMRHMDVYMEQEEKYIEAVMSDTNRIQRKVLSEISGGIVTELCTPPLRWGPWLYYKRVAEGKAYPVLCRRLASENDEFAWNNRATTGFDFKTGQKIEQKLLDLNEVAEQGGGYAYEEMCEISPDHRYLAYTIYVKDKDSFTLCVKDLKTGSLHHKPKVDRVDRLAWSKDGCALFYTVANSSKRPCRLFCSILESSEPDALLMEEYDDSCCLTIRNTKDYQFVTVSCSSSTSARVYLLNTTDHGSGLHKIWECDSKARCILEHHQGYLYMLTDAPRDGRPVERYYLLRRPIRAFRSQEWENVFVDDPNMNIEDIDFFDKNMVLILRKRNIPAVCFLEMPLPLNLMGGMHPNDLSPSFLPVPKDVSHISAGPNYDFYSSVVRFEISSPVMPDAVVDYNLLSREWVIVQQQDLMVERSQVLYGSSSSVNESRDDSDSLKQVNKFVTGSEDGHEIWNDLSEFYECEYHYVNSMDHVCIPLTVVYSRKIRKHGRNPGLLHGHGAYGEILDKRWCSEMKSLLDRGWVIAFADVRGGGAGGKSWHYDGRASKKLNSVYDYIACAKFLIEKEYVHSTKLAAWGYSAGGFLVGAAINICPDLFRAAILKVPFLDTVNTLSNPIIPLSEIDYDEFGYPDNPKDFESIMSLSPYENIQKGVTYPAVLVTSSFKTHRFGVWEAAKWVAKVREYTNSVPSRPILLNVSLDIIEDNRYIQCKETALELAFLIRMMDATSDDNNDEEDED